MKVYPAKYIDKHGEDITTISNDGKTLRMRVQDIEFWGYDFDGLEPETKDSSELQRFTFAQNDLCNCTIECDMPIEVITNEGIVSGKLNVRVELGEPDTKGGVSSEDVILTLSYENKVFRSKGTSGWFEDELLDIERQLPENHKLRCCFGCAFSDYSVYGHGLFGWMLCFRNIKVSYSKVKDKIEFMKIMDKSIETVQETYLCPEFQVRKPDTGYRG